MGFRGNDEKEAGACWCASTRRTVGSPTAKRS